MKQRLIDRLGEDYLGKINKIFPFIETDEDITEFFENNSHFKGITIQEFVRWITSRTERVEKVDFSDIDIDKVSKVFPNVRREEHLTGFFTHLYKNVFIYKGYDVLHRCDVKITLFKEYLGVE